MKLYLLLFDRFQQPARSATVTSARMRTMKPTMTSRLWSYASFPRWRTVSARFDFVKPDVRALPSPDMKYPSEPFVPCALQVYSSTEHLSTSTPSNQSLSSSERSHSEEKEERWEGRGILSPGDGYRHLSSGDRRADGHRGR